MQLVPFWYADGWAISPRKLSTSGAEYAERMAVEKVSAGSGLAADAIESLEARLVATNRGTADDLAVLEASLEALANRVGTGEEQ